MKKLFDKISYVKILSLLLVIILAIGVVMLLNTRPDINTEERDILRYKLREVDGIGSVLADRIIDGRKYASWDDLEETISGVGNKIIWRLKINFKLSSIL